jgi:hypothetical protein
LLIPYRSRKHWFYLTWVLVLNDVLARTPANARCTVTWRQRCLCLLIPSCTSSSLCPSYQYDVCAFHMSPNLSVRRVKLILKNAIGHFKYISCLTVNNPCRW